VETGPDVWPGVADSWIDGNWPTCYKCGAKEVIINGVSKLGGYTVCSEGNCKRSVSRHAEIQVPGTAIYNRYQAIDIDALQTEIDELVAEIMEVKARGGCFD
jgi:hypothetical protein